MSRGGLKGPPPPPSLFRVKHLNFDKIWTHSATWTPLSSACLPYRSWLNTAVVSTTSCTKMWTPIAITPASCFKVFQMPNTAYRVPKCDVIKNLYDLNEVLCHDGFTESFVETCHGCPKISSPWAWWFHGFYAVSRASWQNIWSFKC